MMKRATSPATGSGAGSRSAFGFFRIGLGPSSSHTVGPMRAARDFCVDLRDKGVLESVSRVQAFLHGSLAATGVGHGTDRAVVLGLSGEVPEEVDPVAAVELVESVRAQGRIRLLGVHEVEFDMSKDIVMIRRPLPTHPNGMVFEAADASDRKLGKAERYSVGGGFVTGPEDSAGEEQENVEYPYPFGTGVELLAMCARKGLSVSELMMANECAQGLDESEVRAGLLAVWNAMVACIDAGCSNSGILPGGLRVRRRAPDLYAQLKTEHGSNTDDLHILDWVNLYALAVNEENAAGGRVVTAPTNGAAGVVPAVLRYFSDFRVARAGRCMEDEIVSFLLAAAAVCVLFKRNASISGAEVGCQGEIGSACAMAAAGLTEVSGGTPEQVENAAEIGLEHNLGLTCDPVGGLVQIPCIERNAQAAVKAINASRIALRGDGTHQVSLDQVIKTMWNTGQDMKLKYKETARGGLAATVKIPVNVVEC